VSLYDSFPNLRRHENLSNGRNSFIEQNKVTKLKARDLGMQFAFTLYFTGHNFIDFENIFHLIQLSRDNILEY